MSELMSIKTPDGNKCKFVVSGFDGVRLGRHSYFNVCNVFYEFDKNVMLYLGDNWLGGVYGANYFCF